MLSDRFDFLSRYQRIRQAIDENRERCRVRTLHFGVDNRAVSTQLKLNRTAYERLDGEGTALERNDFTVKAILCKDPFVLGNPERQELHAKTGAPDPQRRGVSVA